MTYICRTCNAENFEWSLTEIGQLVPEILKLEFPLPLTVQPIIFSKPMLSDNLLFTSQPYSALALRCPPMPTLRHSESMETMSLVIPPVINRLQSAK